MIMRVLVTGGAGFVGRHLLAALAALVPAPERWAWRHGPAQGLDPAVHWGGPDLQDSQAVRRAIALAQPTHLVHLAALSNVAQSFADPRQTYLVNVIGTLNLLEALKRESPRTRILLVSSSEVYGQSFAAGRPLDEGAPTQPLNPYAASKLAAEALAGPYWRQGMAILIARPFNHIGPGQEPGFAVPSFAGQLAEIAAGRRPPRLSVGNLEARRDFLHVADVCAAYCGLLAAFDILPPGGVFNVCSGVARRIGDVLDDLIRLSGLVVELAPDPARLRPSDIPAAVGDCGALRQAIGWRPRVDWRETLSQCLEDWRARLDRPA
jgi:GDP-4-dehydro-6-deoxy-D-mannose reductase